MEEIQKAILDFAVSKGPDLLGILVLFFLGQFILKRVIGRIVHMASDTDDSSTSSRERRAETLGKVGIATGKIVIYGVTFVMTLDVLGLDIRPILAGVGVAGLAIGFGAQSLVKDFVSGLFILIENQYGVGDEVKIGSSEGTVIKITMRSTVLKDNEGKITYIANGSINSAINYSQNKK